MLRELWEQYQETGKNYDENFERHKNNPTQETSLQLQALFGIWTLARQRLSTALEGKAFRINDDTVIIVNERDNCILRFTLIEE